MLTISPSTLHEFVRKDALLDMCVLVEWGMVPVLLYHCSVDMLPDIKQCSPVPHRADPKPFTQNVGGELTIWRW